MDRQREYIGIIDEDEVREIEPIIERLDGVEELLMIVDEVEMKEKLNNEAHLLKKQRDVWWKKVAVKYNWQDFCDSDWDIEIETGKICMLK